MPTVEFHPLGPVNCIVEGYGNVNVYRHDPLYGYPGRYVAVFYTWDGFFPAERQACVMDDFGDLIPTKG